jgi:4-amino-4-deoxy-L-arabinose transferase-like glycosyltransferase
MNRLLPTVFIIVNLILYYFSYNGAVFIEAADATQYYLPAVSFLESGQFMRGDSPLTFGPPLYSIFLALPIGLFGLENSSAAIVLLQTILLFVTGYIWRLIFLSLYSGYLKNTYAVLLHALIVLNPNSLITAHLAQSETLFTLLFSFSFLFSIKLLSDFSLKNLVLIGIFAGFAALTRSVALYFLIALPIFLYTVLTLKGNSFSKLKLIVPLLAGLIIISPWYVRNYVEFGEVFYTSNAGSYLKSQYIQLKNKGVGWSRDKGIESHHKQFKEYLYNEPVDRRELCLVQERDWSCNSLLSRSSLQLILNEPFEVHAKALFDSWGTLFLSGGASNIRNYLGLDGKGLIVNFQTKSFNGLESIFKLLKNMDISYFIIFIFTMVFSVTSRIIGLIGFFYVLKNRKWHPFGLLLIEAISIFTASYLYLGQSRFRVPLEPLLMLFTVVGVLYIVKKYKD